MTEQQITFLNREVLWPHVYRHAFSETMCFHLPIDFAEEMAVRQTIKKVLGYFRSVRFTSRAIYKVVIFLLKRDLDRNHSHLFIGGEMKIGICQMIVAQYFKMSWCLFPEFKEPWACPITRRVFQYAHWNFPQTLKEKYGYDDWDKIETLEDYFQIVEILRHLRDDESLASWELNFNG